MQDFSELKALLKNAGPMVWEANEDRALSALCYCINRTTKRDFWTHAGYVDKEIVPLLSDVAQMRLYLTIEERMPQALTQMRNLDAAHECPSAEVWTVLYRLNSRE